MQKIMPNVPALRGLSLPGTMRQRPANPARLLLLTLALCLVFAFPALAADPAGVVVTIKGKGYLVREKQLSQLFVGDRFYQGDTLVTPDKCSMGVTFRDDTTMALGPGSEVRIDEFVFDPAESELGFAAHLRTGTAQFISGQVAHLAPDKMSVTTPLTTIGIRGTRFIVEVPPEPAAETKQEGK